MTWHDMNESFNPSIVCSLALKLEDFLGEQRSTVVILNFALIIIVGNLASNYSTTTTSTIKIVMAVCPVPLHMSCFFVTTQFMAEGPIFGETYMTCTYYSVLIKHPPEYYLVTLNRAARPPINCNSMRPTQHPLVHAWSSSPSSMGCLFWLSCGWMRTELVTMVGNLSGWAGIWFFPIPLGSGYYSIFKFFLRDPRGWGFRV